MVPSQKRSWRKHPSCLRSRRRSSRSTSWARSFRNKSAPENCGRRKVEMYQKQLRQDILECVGNTSLLALRNIMPENGSRILLKLESENPTGSMKDRMALAMIEAAEADGRLRPDGSVVEYTAGSTGVSLALVCAVKAYPLYIVSSDAFAQE